jgi:hypothetical protein
VTPDPARNPESVCEYSFGLFKPTAADCDIFYYRCAYGEAEEVACDKGLAYDDRSHSCNWPDLLLDIGCDPESAFGEQLFHFFCCLNLHFYTERKNLGRDLYAQLNNSIDLGRFIIRSISH